MSTTITRRSLLKTLAGGTLGLALAPAMSHAKLTSPLKGNIRHSVCRWTYGMLPLEDLCLVVKDLGFGAIDLVGPAEWDVLKKEGSALFQALHRFRQYLFGRRFRIYTDSKGPNSGELSSMEACFARIESLRTSPESLRQEADKHRAMADKYEQKAKQLEQQ